MKQYDVKCPICGTMNNGLYLEETQGWMECENCNNTVLVQQIKLKPYMVQLLNAFRPHCTTTK